MPEVIILHGTIIALWGTEKPRYQEKVGSIQEGGGAVRFEQIGQDESGNAVRHQFVAL